MNPERSAPRLARHAGTWLLAVLPALAAAGGKGIVLPPATHTVGPGGDCDYGSLVTAINAAASGDSIHLVSGEFGFIGAGLSVHNKSLSIVGGYASCAAANPDPDNPTRLTKINGGDSLLTVSRNIAGSGSVLLRHLLLSGGDGGAATGGGVDLSGEVLLRLDHVVVSGNTADHGAGVRVHGGPPSPTLRLEGGSRIGGVSALDGGNHATQDGGGIHCDGGARIEWVDAAINFNSAFNGGGLFLNGCELDTPPPAGAAAGLAEIRGNRAVGNGGGLAANLFSTIQLESTRNRPIRIVGNRADEDGDGAGNGGGLWLLFADVHASGLRIDGNQADDGGGVYVSGGSFDMDRGNPTGANCPEKLRCATLSGNQATAIGGAIYAGNSASVDIRQSFIEANQAGNSPLAHISTDAALLLASVQVSGNQATGPGGGLLFAHTADLDFRNVSIAFNDSDISSVLRLQNLSHAVLHDSIFWEAAGVDIVDTGGDVSVGVSADCVNASEGMSIAAATHDPGFWFGQTPPPTIGPPALLYLADDSPNLDACDTAPLPNPAFDAAGRPRVQDIADVADLAGPLDRGALEWQPPLFADGFED